MTSLPDPPAPRPPARIAILGAGSWGTALAGLLAVNGHDVRLWARDRGLVDCLVERRENTRYLPGVPLSPRISIQSDLCAALRRANVVVFAVPSGAVRPVARAAAPHIEPDALLLSASKGLEESTGLRMSQVLYGVLGQVSCAKPAADSEHRGGEAVGGIAGRIVALSGPNLAVEIARGAPSASVAASLSAGAAIEVQQLFIGPDVPTLRVYTSRDVAGVEIGGAVKNAIAIGAGVCDGLGFGDNSKAALMTRGLSEAVRLGVAHGAETSTFLGLSGAGDLIATGGSRLSRNYRVGFALGQGRSLEEALAELDQVAEGVPTTHVLCELAERARIEMPVCRALHALLFEGRSPAEVIRALMLRPHKEEYTG